MRLTNYTDYGLRVLIYLATWDQLSLANQQHIADTFGLSKNHLKKIIHQLGKLELIETIRGRQGGLRLAKSPEQINLGEVIQALEGQMNIVECLDENKNTCLISPVCQLKSVFNEALSAYMNVLHQYTLADVVQNKDELSKILFK